MTILLHDRTSPDPGDKKLDYRTTGYEMKCHGK